MKIFAVYFSGTGNTRYAVDRFLSNFTGSEWHSIEENINFMQVSASFDTILVAYPIYGSDLPELMKVFIKENKRLFIGKKLITLATQYLFSGDGGRVACRLVKKEISEHIASIHINMPTNINLTFLMPVKNGAANHKKMTRANKKIDLCASRIKNGRRITDGTGVFCFLAGFLSQRLWFQQFVVERYKSRIQIERAQCSSCGLCTSICPMHNLKLIDGCVHQQNKCMMCYRCINKCPQQAITLFSKKDALAQYKGIGSQD